MRCPGCGETSQERARFCTACGSALPIHCPACNEVNPQGARFCAWCGTRLPDASIALANAASEAERRPVSVMFCDLVGSTALSTRLDPEDLREVIASLSGRASRDDRALRRLHRALCRRRRADLFRLAARRRKTTPSVRCARRSMWSRRSAATPIRGERLARAHRHRHRPRGRRRSIGVGRRTAADGDRRDAEPRRAAAEAGRAGQRRDRRGRHGGRSAACSTCRDLGRLALKGFADAGPGVAGAGRAPRREPLRGAARSPARAAGQPRGGTGAADAALAAGQPGRGPAGAAVAASRASASRG